MEGIIVNYRGSHKTQYTNQMIVKVIGIDSRDEAKELIKKTVTWITPSKKEMTGTIMKEHGNKGAVRVKFEIGLPGQAISTRVKIE
ncbi:50S ribosomal protein L35ae [archaeon]|jgi:large subunit ribosomal protein L35Ae|nr:50S ribosomal protein L35ae [archaeon]MBT6824371.1 50S ribosomal protein L35ae [archaeon]MBT7106921.1 50S ribosomal protein L35ae [archaeon]MBT7297474.1 50S ribosomal protein L35ae [archaeon]